MDLSNYLLKSYSDPTWMEDYIAKMGESKFWHFRDKIYKTLNQLKVGESMEINPEWEPINIDFYVKVSCCYISESNACYAFNNDYTRVTRHFDRQLIDKQMKSMKFKRNLIITEET